MKILFVCSKNKWRSRTAEKLFKNNGKHAIRSAGTEADARIKLTLHDLHWADKILVMEDKHQDKIEQLTNDQLILEKIEVLGIPDEYPYMDNELIEILKACTQDYFSN